MMNFKYLTISAVSDFIKKYIFYIVVMVLTCTAIKQISAMEVIAESFKGLFLDIYSPCSLHSKIWLSIFHYSTLFPWLDKLWNATDLMLVFASISLSFIFRYILFDISQPTNEYTKYKVYSLLFWVILAIVPFNVIELAFDYDLFGQYAFKNAWSGDRVESVYGIFQNKIFYSLLLQIILTFCLFFGKINLKTKSIAVILLLLYNMIFKNLIDLLFLALLESQRFDPKFTIFSNFLNEGRTFSMEDPETLLTSRKINSDFKRGDHGTPSVGIIARDLAVQLGPERWVSGGLFVNTETILLEREVLDRQNSLYNGKLGNWLPHSVSKITGHKLDQVSDQMFKIHIQKQKEVFGYDVKRHDFLVEKIKAGVHLIDAQEQRYNYVVDLKTQDYYKQVASNAKQKKFQLLESYKDSDPYWNPLQSLSWMWSSPPSFIDNKPVFTQLVIKEEDEFSSELSLRKYPFSLKYPLLGYSFRPAPLGLENMKIWTFPIEEKSEVLKTNDTSFSDSKK